MTVFGYARASTDGQTLDAQLEALKAAGCATIVCEAASGTKAECGQLARLLTTIGGGDVLIVSRLDRLAQSTRDLLHILDTLSQRGAAFRSLMDRWADTTAPHGHLIPTVLGGLAEFERQRIRARAGKGRARAVARGQHRERPPTLSVHHRQMAPKALRTGRLADLAPRFNVSQSTISRLAEKAVAPIGKPLAIDAETERAVRAFMRRLESEVPVIEGILYGSRARGTHREDSDADIAVVLKGEPGNRYQLSGDMAGIAFDVMMETGVMVQAVPLWESELKRPETFSNPALIEAIRREGLRL